MQCMNRTCAKHIVLIVFDYMGYGGIEPFGQCEIRTPNIRRLAKQGIRFTDFYAATPICGASRAAMLTGRYPRRLTMLSMAKLAYTSQKRLWRATSKTQIFTQHSTVSGTWFMEAMIAPMRTASTISSASMTGTWTTIHTRLAPEPMRSITTLK
jgi:hypothetical protein